MYVLISETVENDGLEMVYAIDGPAGSISKDCYKSMSKELEKLGIEEKPEIKDCMLQ